MHAHSQYCQYDLRHCPSFLAPLNSTCRSGDNTLEALQSAIEEVDSMQGDGKFVFLLSDANLRRYGISAQTVRSFKVPVFKTIVMMSFSLHKFSLRSQTSQRLQYSSGVSI